MAGIFVGAVLMMTALERIPIDQASRRSGPPSKLTGNRSGRPTTGRLNQMGRAPTIFVAPFRSWKTLIHDPTERKVFAALDDGPTWRTAGGVARQTGLPEEKVSEISGKYSDPFIRILEDASLTGNALTGLIENVG